MISSHLVSLRRGGLCLSAALFLALTSCASTFVPLVDESRAPSLHSGQDSGGSSAAYESNPSEKDKVARSALLLLLGKRSLEEQFWTPVQDQLAMAVEYTWVSADLPVGFEVGLGLSADSEDIVVGGYDVTATGTTVELYAGPRFETALGNSPVRVFGGLGPSLISASMKAEIGGASATLSDSSLGLYLHAGVLVELGKMYLGLDLRTLSGTSITIGSSDGDADYSQAALVLGFRF